MWRRRDNQEVGLEAAILERVRNSSLVEWSCADNVAGLKLRAEAADLTAMWGGRGASGVCGSGGVNRRGTRPSENVGMSSERGVRNPSAVSPRVPGEG